MNRARGLIIISGVVLTVLCMGMWQSPEINREGFLAAWCTVGMELATLKNDPFAISRILVIITIPLVTYYGFKCLVRG